MYYLSPDTAPTVHIELLPATAKAVDVSLDTSDEYPTLSITTWASGPDIHVKANSENSSEDFVEYTCSDCRYFTDEMQHDADGEEVNGLELTGTYYTYSPCPCYNDGIGSVSFPCENGNDGPEDGEDDDVSTENIRYSILLTPDFDSIAYAGELIYIQGCSVTDEGIKVSSKHSSINCYDNGEVCWGGLNAPSNLSDMLVFYTSSPGNEDLTSISAHADGNWDAITCDGDRPTAVACPTYDHRGKAVVVATAMWNSAAYLLLAGSGCTVNNAVVYVPVSLYPNVAIDDDTVLNVYATDVLSSGTRLLFYHTANDAESYNGQFIGQVPSNFSLEPCTSQLPQSSEQAEPASS